MTRTRRHERGFTLIETLVTVAIAGVLSSIAYPSLEGQVLRARRVDGVAALLQAQLAEERHRANRSAYGSLAEIGLRDASAAGYYTLSARGDVDGFELVATAAGTQVRDTECRTLRMQSLGGGVVYASGRDAVSSNTPAVNRRCWNQ